MGKKRNYYVDPVRLKASIVDMQAKGQMSDDFASMFLEIQEHVLNFPRFKNYRVEVKQAMRDYNVMCWVRYGWKSINPSKNPFAYITQASYLNFLSALKVYFRKQNQKREYLKGFYEKYGLEWTEYPYDEAEKTERKRREFI